MTKKKWWILIWHSCYCSHGISKLKLRVLLAHRIIGIQRGKKAMQFVHSDVDIIICPEKPVKVVQMVITDVLQHCKWLPLRRICAVVDTCNQAESLLEVGFLKPCLNDGGMSGYNDTCWCPESHDGTYLSFILIINITITPERPLNEWQNKFSAWVEFLHWLLCILSFMMTLNVEWMCNFMPYFYFIDWKLL